MENYLTVGQLIKELNKRLSSLNAKKIILFGSYTYGSPNEDSDLDLCVIEEKYE